MVNVSLIVSSQQISLGVEVMGFYGRSMGGQPSPPLPCFLNKHPPNTLPSHSTPAGGWPSQNFYLLSHVSKRNYFHQKYKNFENIFPTWEGQNYWHKQCFDHKELAQILLVMFLFSLSPKVDNLKRGKMLEVEVVR